jgi:hypothetical protein
MKRKEHPEASADDDTKEQPQKQRKTDLKIDYVFLPEYSWTRKQLARKFEKRERMGTKWMTILDKFLQWPSLESIHQQTIVNIQRQLCPGQIRKPAVKNDEYLPKLVRRISIAILKNDHAAIPYILTPFPRQCGLTTMIVATIAALLQITPFGPGQGIVFVIASQTTLTQAVWRFAMCYGFKRDTPKLMMTTAEYIVTHAPLDLDDKRIYIWDGYLTGGPPCLMVSNAQMLHERLILNDESWKKNLRHFNQDEWLG